jgi:3-oxoacyl-[acyl-carrier protein] reductase
MDLEIAGRSALVTGASRGIGFAVADALVREGARVVVVARDGGPLESAAARLRETGEAHAVVADLSTAAGARRAIEAATERVGSPEILVANVGGPPVGKPSALDDGAWSRGFELTLMSAVRLARAALPSMRQRGWGRIVNVTSLSVRQPVLDLTLSNALRAGVTAFARTLASEVAAEGVTVNNVAPGYTATERLEELFADDYTRASLVATIPARRFGAADEIADAVAFLCSARATYITGQTLLVDGGLIGTPF